MSASIETFLRHQQLRTWRPAVRALVIALALFLSGVAQLAEPPCARALNRSDQLLTFDETTVHRIGRYHRAALNALENNSLGQATSMSQLALELLGTLPVGPFDPDQLQVQDAYSSLISTYTASSARSRASVACSLPCEGTFFPPWKRTLQVEVNDAVLKWIAHFKGPGYANFSSWLSAAGRYLPLNIAILEEHGLPAELAVVPMVESGFSNHARSRKRAVGAWQFVGATARRYGLTVNRWIDERRDPQLAAVAAATYLRALYDEFGDWPLALAAYNAGEARVQRAQAKSEAKDFWSLDLPRETRHYVPKFMAALIILRSPEQFGFSPVYESPIEFDTLRTKAPLDLRYLAAECGVSLKELRRLNPALLKTRTAVSHDNLLLRVPPAKHIAFLEAIAKRHEHIVRKGETLSQIAARYGSTVSTIAEVNGIRNPHLIRPGRLLSIPACCGTPDPAAAMWGQVIQEDGTYYIVEPGDNFYDIARRFKLNWKRLMQLNGKANDSFLRPGERILLSRDILFVSGNGPLRHLVRPGETLWRIARRYNVKMERIIEANALKRPDLIQPGHELLIPAGISAR